MKPSFRIQLREQAAPVSQGGLFGNIAPDPVHAPPCDHVGTGRTEPQRDFFGGETVLCTACGQPVS